MSAPAFNPNIMYEDLPKVPSLVMVHGTVMGLAFIIFYPAGALLIRTSKSRYTLWMHIASQMIGWVLMLVGLATGIRTGKIVDQLHNNGHTIVGTVVVAALLLQPVLGYIHHRRFVKTQKRTAWTHTHVWYGRVLLTLGIINGGLGFVLASGTPVYSQAGMIVYAVLAAVAGSALISAIVIARRARTTAVDRSQENDIDLATK